MKKFIAVLCFCLLSVCLIIADSDSKFIVVDRNVDIDDEVYSFLYDFFSVNSKSLLKYGTRFIMDDKNPRYGSDKYYDGQGYYETFALYDKKYFYVIDKIIIKNKNHEDETFDYYLKLGILAEEYYDVTFKVKSVYDQSGTKQSDHKKEFSDTIGIFRYADKCRLSMLGATTAYTWVLAEDEESMVDKIKKSELKILIREDVNHYTRQ